MQSARAPNVGNAPIPARVELLAVIQFANVVNLHHVYKRVGGGYARKEGRGRTAGPGEVLTVAGVDDLNRNTLHTDVERVALRLLECVRVP